MTLYGIETNIYPKVSTIQNLDTLYLNKKELSFKIWLKDTLKIIQHDGSNQNNEIGVKSRCIRLSEDSLSFEIRIVISKLIKRKDQFPIQTIIGSTLYNLKSEHVILPKSSYEIRIAYIELYDISHTDGVYERNYEYDYVSIIPLNSKMETCYTLMKGNLINVKKERKVLNWISSDWYLNCK